MKWIGQHIWDLTSRFRGISIFEKAIKLLKSDGGDGGVISMTGNDMVLSNAAGDVLIGSTTYQVGGDQDIFIGDGINSVDLVFEQSGAIKGYDSSVNLTIGGGGGTITFADKVNFVGGGIDDEFQFNNLTIDGNFELSPITTTTSGGVLNGGFLNPAAEAKQVHMPQVLNDLAGFNHWGTVTVTGLYKTRTGSPGSYAYSNPVLPSDFASAFDGTSSTAGSWYSDNGASGTVQGEGVITLEWTNEATYGLWFGLVFGQDGFVPSRIKMEAYQTDVGWRTFADLTDVSATDIGNIILRQIDGNSGTGAATNKLRFTLGSSISGSYLYFRIHTIYLANYAQGNNNLSGLGTDRTRGYHYLERYRPNYAWGHFYPGQTTTYNLGGSSYRWAIGYFNSLDVAQSINIAGSISASSSVGNLNVSAGIGQDLEYGSTAVTTLRFDSDRWRLYAGGTSSELMTVQENGNVGIGTTSPHNKAHITSSGNQDGLLLDLSTGSSGDYTGVYFKVDNNTTNAYKKGGLVWERTGSYNEGRFHFLLNNEDNTNNVDLTDSKFTILSTGNVGVGTTSPGGKLDVAGNTDAMVILGRAKFGSYVSDYLYLSHFDQGSTTNYALNQSPAGSTSINAPTGQNVALKINNSTKLFLQGTTGNVGIGTTSPNKNLTVEWLSDNTVITQEGLGGGAAGSGVLILNGSYIANTYANLDFRAGNADGRIAYKYNSINDGDFHFITDNGNSPETKLFIKNNGKVGIGTTNPLQELQVEGSIYANGGDLYVNDGKALISVGDLLFKTFESGAYHERARILANGNVGIGTASPDSLLHVAGEITTEDQINFKNVNGSLLKITKDSWTTVPTHDLIYQGWDTTVDDYIYLKAPGNTTTTHGIALIGDNVIALGRTNNETGAPELTSAAAPLNDNWLVLNSTSATFSGRADFQKDLRLRGTDAAANQGVVRFYVDSSNKLFIDTVNDGSNLFAIDSSGNVGIGTSSPGQKLEVDEGYINVTGAGTSHGYELERDGLDTYRIRHLDGGLTIQNSTDSRKEMTFDGDGNVGIGTISPSDKLEVNGNVQASSYKISGVTVLSGSANVSLGSSGATGTISLNTHTSTALYVAGDDNVGIGTTTPSEKLEVNGKIKATDINFSGLPTSSAGLSSGDVWNDGGTLKIVS